MKTFFTTAFLFAMIVFMLTPSQSFAQSGTLVIYANSSLTLDQVINGDVSGGVNNHSVYQLVSTDTTYLLDATITSQSSISIIGVPDPTTGKLPCVEADVLSGGQIPGIFFTFTGEGTRISLINLYLLGITPNGTNNTAFGQGVQISADNISLTVDNCVFDFFSQFEIAFSSNWNKFYITNSKFINGFDVASAYYVPELLRSLNGAGNWFTDTISIKYNTLLCVAMGPVITTGITRYFDFSHNDILLTTKAPFWSEPLVNAKINDNIFYNVYALGESRTEYNGGWDEINPPRIPALFSLFRLDSLRAATFLGHPINGTADSLEAEAARNVEVRNNAYLWSPGLTSFWTAWNDTATVDSIYTPVFMNDETVAMFNNPSVWPGFVQSGNQSADPQFGPTIDKVLNPGSDTTYGVGLLNYFTAVRGGMGTTEYYAYQKTQVGTNIDWTPPWPLPCSTDLQYANTTLKNSSTDGLPLGDPYWFNGWTGVDDTSPMIADKFTLSEAYPNPFNPSTNIKFTIAKSGNVSLKVYNITGQLVMTVLDNKDISRGSYSYKLDMSRFASGIYLYTLQQDNNFIAKKMILLK
jgi:hypothetical protein